MENEYNIGILSQVLNKLLKPGTYLTEDHVTKLVKFVTGVTDPVTRELFDHVLQLWLAEAIEQWETTDSTSSPVLTLAVNIIVYLSSRELIFRKLNEKNLLDRFIKLLKTAIKNLNAAPNVGYVKILKAVLNHKEGCQWILTTSYWSEIINLALVMEPNSEMVKECNNFIVKLLEESFSVHPDCLLKVFSVLITPIMKFSETMQKRGTFNEQEFLNQHSRSVYLLAEIIESVLTTKNFALCEFLTETLRKYDFVDKYCIPLFLKITNLDGYYGVCYLMSMLLVIDLVSKTKGAPIITYEDYLKIGGKKMRIYQKIEWSQAVLIFPKILHNLIRVDSKMGNIFPKIRMNDKIVEMGDQLIYEQLFPVVYSSKYFKLWTCGNDTSDEKQDQLRAITMEKHYNRLLPISFYHFYGMESYMRHNFSFVNCLSTLEYILHARKYYDRNRANIVMSLCIYNYEDISQLVSREDVTPTPTPPPFIMEYLSYLMEVIATFIVEFDLNWQDIVETLTLMEITLTLLSSSKSTTCVIIKGLNLIRIVVRKKLSLSLALLTNQIDGDMDKLLSTCAKKLDDENWEISNASAQVLESVLVSQVIKDSDVFHSMILNKQIPTKITRIAFSYENNVLKASALKCLQEMIKVQNFWINILTETNVCGNACQIVIDEKQKTVHKEAAKLIAIIYKENYNLNHAVLCKFYDVMTYIITDDFDTDTKINALEFWKFVVLRHLTDQGWIDGKFPDVTFSTDTKKIVIMSDTEIRKRLVKVLFKLSDNGCLFALKAALEDKNNEFFNTVKIFWKRMSDVLNQYNVDSSRLKLLGDLHSKSFDSEILENSFNCTNKIRRQTLHPEVFLTTMDFFSNNFETTQTSNEKCDVIPLFEEILYGGLIDRT